jgi:Tol biopolymer transport system component
MLATTGDVPKLYTVSAHTPGFAQFSTPEHAVTTIVWAPTGDVAAFVTQNGDLGFWTPESHAVSVVSGVTGVPVWSADGKHLAFHNADGVSSFQLVDGSKATVVRMPNVNGPVTPSWAPDGKGLAVTTGKGVMIATSDGSAFKQVDNAPADGGRLVWTVAG